jgi:hypothetical protein
MDWPVMGAKKTFAEQVDRRSRVKPLAGQGDEDGRHQSVARSSFLVPLPPTFALFMGLPDEGGGLPAT